MYATQTLATYVRAFAAEDLSEVVRDKTLCCILDVMTAAIVGYDAPSAVAVRRVATQLFGAGSSSVWFSGETLSSAGAAFCNSAAASALDLDDGHRVARGHPGAAVVPAALAVADGVPCTCEEIQAAIALGYEISVRVAAAQNQTTIRSRQSGRWVGYGAVAAAARLSGTAPPHLAHAMAIAGVLSPNQDANGSSGYSDLTGNDVKEGIPWGVVTGLTALHLAECGYTGPADILDHASHFDTSTIVGMLVQPQKILGTYFKIYSCCRYIHPAIDAFYDLKVRHGLTHQEIEAVEVEIFAWALQLGNRLEPESLTDIQYSLPYCMAIAAIESGQPLSPIDTSLLDRPDLTDFSGKVRMSVDADIDRRFPAETLARVTVVARTGERFASPVTTPRGDVGRPMLWPDVRKKFLAITRTRMEGRNQLALLDGLDQFRNGDATLLRQTLAQPLV